MCAVGRRRQVAIGAAWTHSRITPCLSFAGTRIMASMTMSMSMSMFYV